MNGRKILQGTAFLAALSLCAPAGADTFGIENRALAEDDTTFDVDCGGPVEEEAADCAERAAALHAELVDLLSGLSGESDARTVALFESVATMSDPQLQAMALRYFASQQEAPVTLWDQAQEFFFGPDADVGHPSAELLARSADEIEQQLSEAYLEGRPLPKHGGELPEGAGFEDSWALGYAQDARLDDVPSFIEAELFPGATRLLMLDRFIVDAFDPDADPEGLPITAFVTDPDADVSEVEAHFTSVFGAEPYPPVAQLEARQDELTSEFNELAMNFSDPAAVMRFQELTEELQKNQAALLVAGQIGLDSDEYADHVFWVTLSSDQFATGPLPRAVTLGTDTRLESHVIRYVNGAASDDVTSPNGPGSGGSNGEGAAPGDPEPSDGAGGDHERAATKGDSGCGCRTSSQGSLAPSLTALALLALTWKSRSRRRASS